MRSPEPFLKSPNGFTASNRHFLLTAPQYYNHILSDNMEYLYRLFLGIELKQLSRKEKHSF